MSIGWDKISQTGLGEKLLQRLKNLQRNDAIQGGASGAICCTEPATGELLVDEVFAWFSIGIIHRFVSRPIDA